MASGHDENGGSGLAHAVGGKEMWHGPVNTDAFARRVCVRGERKVRYLLKEEGILQLVWIYLVCKAAEYPYNWE